MEGFWGFCRDNTEVIEGYKGLQGYMRAVWIRFLFMATPPRTSPGGWSFLPSRA